MTTSALEFISERIRNDSLIRCEDSNAIKTISLSISFSFCNEFKSLIKSFRLFGKKPTNIHFLACKHERTKAFVTDDEPGIESYGIFRLTTSFTSKNPGSDTKGVPASDISETFCSLSK